MNLHATWGMGFKNLKNLCRSHVDGPMVVQNCEWENIDRPWMDGSVLVAICDSRRLSFLLLASHMGRLHQMLTLSDGHDGKRRNQYVGDRWSISRIRLISPESNRNVVEVFAKPFFIASPILLRYALTWRSRFESAQFTNRLENDNIMAENTSRSKCIFDMDMIFECLPSDPPRSWVEEESWFTHISCHVQNTIASPCWRQSW